MYPKVSLLAALAVLSSLALAAPPTKVADALAPRQQHCVRFYPPPALSTNGADVKKGADRNV